MVAIVMFESTLPAKSADLMRVSAFRRYLLDDTQPDTESARLGTGFLPCIPLWPKTCVVSTPHWGLRKHWNCWK